MKANELRIGNWVTVLKSLPKQVTGYHLNMMENYRPKDPNKEPDYSEMTNPIPLSEEWLIKFGFDIEWTVGGFLKWEKPVSHENTFKLLDRRLPYPQLHKSEARIEYVHQLQNLYFALTGEELTIKE